MKMPSAIVLSCFIATIASFALKAQGNIEIRRVRLQQVPLVQAFDSISALYQVNFSYNARLSELNRLVSLDYEGTLSEVLRHLVAATSLDFEVVGRQVVIFPIISLPATKSAFAPTDSFFILYGKIINYQKEPLSYASVGLLHRSVSTVANADGRFMLKIPYVNSTDTLVITHLGYEPLRIRLDTLTRRELVFQLRDAPVELSPVWVRSISASSIVEQVVRNISNNYSKQNAMYSAFYREIIRDNEDYLSIIEALVDIAKAPYSGWLNDQARIFKGHRSQATKKLQAFSFKLEGGVYNAVKIDLIKEQPSFLSKEGISEYVYRLQGKIAYNERMLYVIRFEPLRRLPEMSYEGVLYVDDKTYALAGATFSLTSWGVDYAQHLLVKKVPRKTQVKLQEANYMVFYRPFNNRWYLEYTVLELKLKAKSNTLFYNNTVTTRSELVVTNIDTTNYSRFRWNEIVRSDDILADKIDAYHDEYWEQYNIILPEEPLIEAINMLNGTQINHKTPSLWKLIFSGKSY
ncbi:MAG: carboxypeptidase-like regulatory domain-containing protein [Bacteroidales bacterium]